MTFPIAPRVWVASVAGVIALLLGLQVSSAAVYYNDVLINPSQWMMKSSDNGGVTVKQALQNSENRMIVDGVNSVNGYDLTILNFWQKSSDGDYLDIQVRQNGSVANTCYVYSVKSGAGYQTVCGQ